MGVVKVLPDSIRLNAVLDVGTNTSLTIQSDTASNPNIIELVAGEALLENQLIYIDSTDGKAYKADYSGNMPCNAICIRAGAINDTIQAQIAGLIAIYNNTFEDFYLGSDGNIKNYSYEPNKLLQYVARKIDNNRILLNIQSPALME